MGAVVLSFSVSITCWAPSILVGPRRALAFAFLESSQVMLLLLVQGLHLKAAAVGKHGRRGWSHVGVEEVTGAAVLPSSRIPLSRALCSSHSPAVGGATSLRSGHFCQVLRSCGRILSGCYGHLLAVNFVAEGARSEMIR